MPMELRDKSGEIDFDSGPACWIARNSQGMIIRCYCSGDFLVTCRCGNQVETSLSRMQVSIQPNQSVATPTPKTIHNFRLGQNGIRSSCLVCGDLSVSPEDISELMSSHPMYWI